MQSEKYISELKDRTERLKSAFEKEFSPLSEKKLNFKPTPQKWSINECISHLILANELYIVELTEEISDGIKEKIPPSLNYKRGWFGKYISKKIVPNKDGSLSSKSKTFKAMEPRIQTPENIEIPHQNIEAYLQQLDIILNLLDLALKTSLKRLKIKTAIGNFIKLEIGNAFDFMIGHNERHLQQALNVKKLIKDDVAFSA